MAGLNDLAYQYGIARVPGATSPAPMQALPTFAQVAQQSMPIAVPAYLQASAPTAMANPRGYTQHPHTEPSLADFFPNTTASAGRVAQDFADGQYARAAGGTVGTITNVVRDVDGFGPQPADIKAALNSGVSDFVRGVRGGAVNSTGQAHAKASDTPAGVAPAQEQAPPTKQELSQNQQFVKHFMEQTKGMSNNQLTAMAKNYPPFMPDPKMLAGQQLYTIATKTYEQKEDALAKTEGLGAPERAAHHAANVEELQKWLMPFYAPNLGPLMGFGMPPQNQ